MANINRGYCFLGQQLEGKITSLFPWIIEILVGRAFIFRILSTISWDAFYLVNFPYRFKLPLVQIETAMILKVWNIFPFSLFHVSFRLKMWATKQGQACPPSELVPHASPHPDHCLLSSAAARGHAGLLRHTSHFLFLPSQHLFGFFLSLTL